MQLPQKTMDMTGAESQPEHKAGAQCGTSKPDVLLPPGMEPSVFPQPGGMPGMVVTADIMIGKKTVLDYLLKPILKAKQNALRER